MAYDEFLADRIRAALHSLDVAFSETKMMGGLCFKVDNKMLCGTHIDKKFGDSLLMVRIGEATYQIECEKDECLPMDFTGRPMRGYAFVTPEGISTKKKLTHWLELCLAFNPQAKISKPRKKK